MVKRTRPNGHWYIGKFRTLMKLKCSAHELRKFIEFENLSPGVSFGGWYDYRWHSGSSKADIIEELVAGDAFVEGSEEKIAKHFGFRE